MSDTHEVVEHVARALYEEWQGPEPSRDSSLPWDQLHEGAKSGWRSSAQAAITALSARTPSAGEGAGEMAKAIKVGERFLNACNAAWAAGEPSHRVKTMLDLADEFRAALSTLREGSK